jgi:Sulfotransferase domain
VPARIRPIDAIIAGAQKAGTSSLAGYLAQHPSVCTHERLELSFLTDDIEFERGYETSFSRHFGHCPGESLLLSKSAALMTERRLVERMHEHNPSMRVIAVLRNPVDRAYSAYWWARQAGYESLPTFEAALEADPARHGRYVVAIRSTSYVAFGEYVDQLDSMFQVHPRSLVRVYLFEDLVRDPGAICRDAFEFLGVDTSFEPDLSRRENESGRARSARLARMLAGQSAVRRTVRRLAPRMSDRLRRRLDGWNVAPFKAPPMSPATRSRLERHYEPYNRRLAELLGRELPDWTGSSPPGESMNPTS